MVMVQQEIKNVKYLITIILVGFGLACAPCAARTRLFELIATSKRGAARLPPPSRPSQLRCFLFDHKKYIKSKKSKI
jgi:hypothetical protein